MKRKTKLKIISCIPEKLLPVKLKEYFDKLAAEEMEEMKMQILRMNWQKASLEQQLKKMRPME